MDLVAADPDGGPRLLIDVTVADPLRTAAESAVDRGHAARVVEGLKCGPSTRTIRLMTRPHPSCSRDILMSWSPFDSRIFFGCALAVQPRRESETRSSMIGAEASQLSCYYRQRIQSVCFAVRHDQFVIDQLEPYMAHWELGL
jgi:hypothetical protein